MRFCVVLAVVIPLVACEQRATLSNSADSAPAAFGAAADSLARVALTADFQAGLYREDSAAVTLARYLELSREGVQSPPGALDSLMGCSMGDGMQQPIERLAYYAVTGRLGSGDSAVVRAEVITVAEEDGSPTDVSRFVAVQRVRRDVREWDVVREGGRWRVCRGPQFGSYGPDSATTWLPAGASLLTARALADSVWAFETR